MYMGMQPCMCTTTHIAAHSFMARGNETARLFLKIITKLQINFDMKSECEFRCFSVAFFVGEPVCFQLFKLCSYRHVFAAMCAFFDLLGDILS
jgi:hypothetical protein